MRLGLHLSTNHTAGIWRRLLHVLRRLVTLTPVHLSQNGVLGIQLFGIVMVSMNLNFKSDITVNCPLELSNLLQINFRIDMNTMKTASDFGL
uniref:Uncharacterized protein n=1 Tax=Strigamia maritima TaxID=126957 RepID=T1J5F0_STRMM